MRTSVLIALELLLTLLLIAPVSADDASFVENAEKHLQAAAVGESTGVAVLVARDGKVVFEGGYGLADLENKTPITPKTKFRIGSVTKQFTAVAILKLIEQGKLTLDDPLSKFFPEVAGSEAVTIRQLLTHTSGLKSYTDKPEFVGRVTKPIAPEELIAWFREDPPDFAPGAGFHYNNSAYFLLGEIAAKVSGKTLADHFKETLFEPLGMSSTGIFVNASPPADMARGYSYVDGKFTPALDWDMSWAGGAGALYSTVGDLYLWNEALFGGKLLSPESFQAATTPIELPPDVDGLSYGFGLVISTVKRLPAIGHGGGLNGWSSDLLRLPEQHCTVVVLGNALPPPPQLTPAAISRVLAEKLLEDEIQKVAPPEEDKSIDPKTFVDYAGSYEYQNAVMTVTVEGDALFAQLTDQPRNQIFPKSKDHFFWKDVDAEVRFLRDESGAVVAARHSQNGNSFRAPKLNDAVKLTPEQAEQFVGKYRYGLFSVMTVTRDGGQLFAQLTGQPKYPIFPKSETEFQWRVVEASVKFEVGEDGQVTKAVHTQNGASFDAPRIK